jgi:single-stranded DNA-binding protein
VVVEGSLRTSTFETGGVKRSKTEILAREICFAGKKADALPDTDITLPTATPAHRNGKNGTPAGYSEQMMDEIPF